MAFQNELLSLIEVIRLLFLLNNHAGLPIQLLYLLVAAEVLAALLLVLGVRSLQAVLDGT